VKTIADWIQVKLHESEMAPYQLGEKMGIAAKVVNAWQGGTARPTGLTHVKNSSIFVCTK